MSDADLRDFQAQLEAAETNVDQLRTEAAVLADAQRALPDEQTRASLKRAKAALAAAIAAHDRLRTRVRIIKNTGSRYGLLAEKERVVGVLAVEIGPGLSQKQRGRIIDAAITPALEAAVAELRVLLGAAPDRFVRELPGRDESGRTVFEVEGRVEGDVLLPAVSPRARAAK